jgi:uncharacterized protein YbjT (DUF2867 family)
MFDGRKVCQCASDVFISGGTGYLGGQLIPLLLERGYRVRALARRGSSSKVPGCGVVTGN